MSLAKVRLAFLQTANFFLPKRLTIMYGYLSRNSGKQKEGTEPSTNLFDIAKGFDWIWLQGIKE